jgi:hypothetical protein
LGDVGLGHTPSALVRAFSIAVIPSMLYGCELWGLQQVYNMLILGASPFQAPTLSPILTFFKKLLGIHIHAPDAFVHTLVNLPTFL